MRNILLLLIMISISTACSNDDKHEENVTFLKAQTCRQQGSPEKAETMAQNYLHQYPDDPDMKLLLASIYFQKKDYAGARALLEPAIKQYPKYTDLSTLLTRVNQAEAAQASGQNPDAIGDGTSKDANSLNEKQTTLNHIQALKTDGDLESAKTVAWKYLRNHPFDLDVQMALVSIYKGKAIQKVDRAKYKCE